MTDYLLNHFNNKSHSDSTAYNNNFMSPHLSTHSSPSVKQAHSAGQPVIPKILIILIADSI